LLLCSKPLNGPGTEITLLPKAHAKGVALRESFRRKRDKNRRRA
jgi:hypothetical protein